MWRKSAALLVIALAAGCTSPQARQFAVDSASAAGAIARLDSQYDQARDAVLRLDLTPEERAELAAVHRNLSALRTYAKTLSGESLLALSDLRYLYVQAQTSYEIARSIVEAHDDELTPLDRIRLQQIDEQAERLDASIQRIFANPGAADTKNAVMNVLAIGGLITKVILTTL